MEMILRLTNLLMSKSVRFRSMVRRNRVKKAKRVVLGKQYLPKPYKRIYHVHIRKSAGTSFNSLFLAQAHLTLDEFWREPVYIKNGKVFVQHQKLYIDQGNYYFASSHCAL